jgi:hypothetical protein
MKIDTIIIFGKETNVAVMAPLNNVQRQTWKMDSWTTWHNVSIVN